MSRYWVWAHWEPRLSLVVWQHTGARSATEVTLHDLQAAFHSFGVEKLFAVGEMWRFNSWDLKCVPLGVGEALAERYAGLLSFFLVILNCAPSQAWHRGAGDRDKRDLQHGNQVGVRAQVSQPRPHNLTPEKVHTGCVSYAVLFGGGRGRQVR